MNFIGASEYSFKKGGTVLDKSVTINASLIVSIYDIPNTELFEEYKDSKGNLRHEPCKKEDYRLVKMVNNDKYIVKEKELIRCIHSIS